MLNPPAYDWQAEGDSGFATAHDQDPRYNNPDAYVLGGSVQGQKKMMGDLAQGWQDSQGRGPVQANTGVYNSDLALAQDSRGSQNDALSYWQRASMGQDVSPAQRQYMLAAQMSSLNNMSAAAGARGGGPGAVAASRAAAMANTSGAAQSYNGMQALKAQEMQAAMAGYSNAANGIRGQDQATSAMDAQFAQQQAQLANAQRGRNDAMEQFYAGQYMSNAEQNASRSASNYFQSQGMNQAAAEQNFHYQQQDAQKRDAVIGATAAGVAQGGQALYNYATSGETKKNPYDD